MMNSELPELNHDSALLWIDVIADNELSRQQRLQLLAFLEHADDVSLWRAMAVAMLDQNSLTTELRAPTAEWVAAGTSPRMPAKRNGFPALAETPGEVSPSKSVARPAAVEVNPGGRRFYPSLFLATTVAMLLVGFAIGNVWNRGLGDQTIADLRQQQSIQTTQVQWLAAQLQNERQAARTLSSIFPDQSALIEIENSPTHALYLTDRDIPESMVECFVEAGHEVEVRPYEPEFKTELMQSLDKPVLQIEVTKRIPLLALQGE